MTGIQMKRLPPFVRWISVFLIIFLLSALFYELLIPPFENSDEVEHLAYATCWATLISNGVQDARNTPHVGQERYQPPIYYLSCVPFVWFYNLREKFSVPTKSPVFNYSPAAPGKGAHRLFESLDRFSSPSMILTARACRTFRFISLAWAIAACIFGAAWIWKLSGNDMALTIAATSFFMFNPRWVETAVSVGNDAAAVCMANIVLWLIFDTVLSIHPISKKRLISLGVACSFASLTKFSCLGLVPIALVAVLMKNGRDSYSWSIRLNSAFLFLLAVLVPLTPWLAANFILYGDPLVIKKELWSPFVKVRESDLGLLDFLRSEFQGFRWSYWAVFGQFAVLMDESAYKILDGFLLLTSLAAFLFILRLILETKLSGIQYPQILPALWIGTLLIMFLRYNSIIYASQGRLLFPAGFAIAYYVSAGLLSPLPKGLTDYAAGIISLTMIAFVAYVGLFVLWPAYGFAVSVTR